MFLNEHPWCLSDVKKLKGLFGQFPQRLDELPELANKTKSPAIRNAAAVSGIGLHPLSFLTLTVRDFVATRYRRQSAASSPPTPFSSASTYRL
jgi:hypothetical protein